MLQNEKYIEFAEDNTVEVLCLQEVDKGMKDASQKAKSGTYEAKDETGKTVTYLKEYAGMSVEHLNTLNSSPAGQYNDSGFNPYIAIVDPHTLKKMKGLTKGSAAGGLMDAVAEAKATLNKEHGPSMKRSTLLKFQAGVKAVEESLTKGGSAKALGEYRKLEASIAKEPQALKDEAKKLEEKLLDAAKSDLDKADGFIAAGDMKAASALLKPFASLLKGTDLEARLKELLEKTKPAPAAK